MILDYLNNKSESLSLQECIQNIEKYAKLHVQLKNKCNQIVKLDHLSFQCHTCAINQAVQQCQACFFKSNHLNHIYTIETEFIGQCDCGDQLAFQKSGCCTDHSKFQEEKEGDYDFDENLIVAVYKILIIEDQATLTCIAQNKYLLRLAAVLVLLSDENWDINELQNEMKTNYPSNCQELFNPNKISLFRTSLDQKPEYFMRFFGESLPEDNYFRTGVVRQIGYYAEKCLLSNEIVANGFLEGIMHERSHVGSQMTVTRLTDAVSKYYLSQVNSTMTVAQTELISQKIEVFNSLKFMQMKEVAYEVFSKQIEAIINIIKEQDFLATLFSIDINQEVENQNIFSLTTDRYRVLNYHITFVYQLLQILPEIVPQVKKEDHCSNIVKLIKYQLQNQTLTKANQYNMFPNYFVCYYLTYLLQYFGNDFFDVILTELNMSKSKEQIVKELFWNTLNSFACVEYIVNEKVKPINKEDLLAILDESVTSYLLNYDAFMQISSIKTIAQVINISTLLEEIFVDDQIRLQFVAKLAYCPFTNDKSLFLKFYLTMQSYMSSPIFTINQLKEFQVERYTTLAKLFNELFILNQQKPLIDNEIEVAFKCYVEPTMLVGVEEPFWNDLESSLGAKTYQNYTQKLQQYTRIGNNPIVPEIQDLIKKQELLVLEIGNNQNNKYPMSQQIMAIRLLISCNYDVSNINSQNLLIKAILQRDTDVKQVVNAKTQLQLLKLKHQSKDHESVLQSHENPAQQQIQDSEEDLCAVCHEKITDIYILPVSSFLMHMYESQINILHNCQHKMHVECLRNKITDGCCPICKSMAHENIYGCLDPKFKLSKLQQTNKLLYKQLKEYCKEINENGNMIIVEQLLFLQAALMKMNNPFQPYVVQKIIQLFELYKCIQFAYSQTKPIMFRMTTNIEYSEDSVFILESFEEFYCKLLESNSQNPEQIAKVALEKFMTDIKENQDEINQIEFLAKIYLPKSNLDFIKKFQGQKCHTCKEKIDLQQNDHVFTCLNCNTYFHDHSKYSYDCPNCYSCLVLSLKFNSLVLSTNRAIQLPYKSTFGQYIRTFKGFPQFIDNDSFDLFLFSAYTNKMQRNDAGIIKAHLIKTKFEFNEYQIRQIMELEWMIDNDYVNGDIEDIIYVRNVIRHATGMDEEEEESENDFDNAILRQIYHDQELLEDGEEEEEGDEEFEEFGFEEEEEIDE
ncbi:Putative_zinc finger in N-recognin (UBR box) and ring finger domain-containing protein [Hexamita inflata]|uniref:E3 ubiquitin-protein ligase n=1 Tax=Hexamita inflata TaxID=28002 RepID=A0AA86P0T9_9EUKA|nr:Putative zinc finger in N-recognin (UBR box) and ring finger domain-containing protein [Hexamita inflata]